MNTEITIVMIDDLPARHNWLRHIIEFLNTTNSIGISFKAHWVDSVPAGEASQIAEEVISALRIPNAVFLMDLRLNEQSTESGKLKSSLEESSHNLEQLAAAEWNRVAGETSHDACNVFNKYEMATMSMVVIKNYGRAAFLVSSAGLIGEGDAIQSSGYAQRPQGVRAFPDIEPPKEPSEQSQIIVRDWASVILSAVDPMFLLRAKTQNWFTTNPSVAWVSFEANGPPHNLPKIDNKFILDYSSYLEKCFPWCCGSALTITDDLKALHQALISAVGDYAQWMGRSTADRPLSLVGAYFFLRFAFYHSAPAGTDPAFLDIPEWSLFHRKTDSNEFDRTTLLRFLPSQKPELAEASVRLLFSIFSELSKTKDDESTCGINGFEAPAANRPWFRIRLNWKAGYENFSEKAGKLLKATLGPKAGGNEFPECNLAGLMMRFSVASQVSDCGFGSFGILRLEITKDAHGDEEYWLRVGGVVP